MPLSFLGNLFSNVTNSIFQDISNVRNIRHADYWNQRNLEFQQETNALNRRMAYDINAQQIGLQHEAWGREDNAVQRRVSDLRSAGINPVLAAGSAAQASGPINLNTPRDEAPQARHLARVEAMRIQTDMVERALRMRDDFATNAATRRVLEETAKEHAARTRQINASTDYELASFDTRLKQLSNTVDMQGPQAAFLELNNETARLRNQGIISQNHGIVLDNIEREIRNEFSRAHNIRNMNEQHVRILAMTIANDLALHEYDTYRMMGTTRTGGMVEKLIQAYLNRLDDLTEGSNNGLLNWILRR